MIRILSLFLSVWILQIPLFAAETIQYQLDFNKVIDSIQFSSSVGLLIALGSISLIPFFLFSTTSFLRIVIVMSMIRSAIGIQQTPPNAVLISLATFLTIFVMAPTFSKIQQQAVIPYTSGKISQGEAINAGLQPFREFMLNVTREKDLALFIEFSRIKNINSSDDIPIFVIIPSFIISELKASFQIGFLLFIPFVVIDLIVSNILLSLGMFMLSPVMISLPFKILLFVLADGWNLITKGLILSFV
ncbi:MAG: flagellar type III secretion system pore protein FliP [Candidatus Margulisbacteria bacterium]|nr:flagellar type III secretion system pore protein FliP [Candidatus Margulisiibacteriota bacterium]